MKISLDCLTLGNKAVVDSLAVSGKMRQMFLDIGVVTGESIKAALISPFGDPTAYQVGGTLIAIRREDAKGILVEAEV